MARSFNIRLRSLRKPGCSWHEAITATRAGLMALRPVGAIAISTSIARVDSCLQRGVDLDESWFARLQSPSEMLDELLVALCSPCRNAVAGRQSLSLARQDQARSPRRERRRTSGELHRCHFSSPRKSQEHRTEPRSTSRDAEVCRSVADHRDDLALARPPMAFPVPAAECKLTKAGLPVACADPSAMPITAPS